MILSLVNFIAILQTYCNAIIPHLYRLSKSIFLVLKDSVYAEMNFDGVSYQNVIMHKPSTLYFTGLAKCWIKSPHFAFSGAFKLTWNQIRIYVKCLYIKESQLRIIIIQLVIRDSKFKPSFMNQTFVGVKTKNEWELRRAVWEIKNVDKSVEEKFFFRPHKKTFQLPEYI